MSGIETGVRALGMVNDIPLISQVLHTLISCSPDGGHPLFERWLSEAPPEEASRAVFEFKALNEAQDVILSKLSALDSVRDRATVLPLLDQWIAIANEILENSLVKSQPEGAKKYLESLEKFEWWRALYDMPAETMEEIYMSISRNPLAAGGDVEPG